MEQQVQFVERDILLEVAVEVLKLIVDTTEKVAMVVVEMQAQAQAVVQEMVKLEVLILVVAVVEDPEVLQEQMHLSRVVTVEKGL